MKLDEKRIATRERLVAEGKLIRISTMPQAIAWGQGWQQAYHSMEAAHTLALAQLEASELLLRLANEELDRLRALVQQ